MSEKELYAETGRDAFSVLSEINCNEHTEQKNGLTYLSWAWAWAEVKKQFPLAEYAIYENQDGWNYFTDGKTCWVKTGVTINGLEHIEYLPVMDYKNKSIGADVVTSFDVNKAIQRSLTKACARHGLGLYIYAGEDLPEAYVPAFEKFEKTCIALGIDPRKKALELALSTKSSEKEWEAAYRSLKSDGKDIPYISQRKELREDLINSENV